MCVIFLAIDCGFLFAPRNGSVHGERTTYPNTVRFSCDEGFTLLGSTKRTCQTNGAWSGTKAVCKGNKVAGDKNTEHWFEM